ncbi:hypothetical protein DUI70_3721 [Streptomyces albus]|nr:hypothetical protein SLNHY_3785 [Streptomyces albus]AYN34223.1 hypothetical protein DUI70_3721 [Streptomyces albus]
MRGDDPRRVVVRHRNLLGVCRGPAQMQRRGLAGEVCEVGVGPV